MGSVHSTCRMLILFAQGSNDRSDQASVESSLDGMRKVYHLNLPLLFSGSNLVCCRGPVSGKIKKDLLTPRARKHRLWLRSVVS